MDRREFLQLMGAASAGAVLAKSGALRSMGLSRSGDSTSTSLPNPNTSTQPIVVGKGSTPITMWVQLFGPAVIWFHTAASNYASKNPDVTITVLPVPYTSLQSKILPSIAAGTEADIMFAYNDWFFSNDVTELFLNLSKYMGGAKTLDAIAYPSALSAVALPAGQAYYVPDLAGIRGASLTVNATQFEKKGINYLNLATWDDVISAAKELTEFKGSTMVRSGLSPITGLANLAMLQSWVWQLGGEFYNTETGKWNFSTAEGKAAAQALYDLYWTDKVASFDLANINNETTQFQRGLVSSNLNGMWQISSIEETVPGFSADAIVTPLLTGHTASVWDPDAISVITLSKALESDQSKLQHCVGLLEELTSASSTLSVFGSYSGATALKSVYASPDLAKERFGKVVARIGPTVWKLGRYNRDHVSNKMPAVTELTLGLQKQTSLTSALASVDTYLNQQESEARQRLGLHT